MDGRLLVRESLTGGGGGGTIGVAAAGSGREASWTTGGVTCGVGAAEDLSSTKSGID